MENGIVVSDRSLGAAAWGKQPTGIPVTERLLKHGESKFLAPIKASNPWAFQNMPGDMNSP